MKMVGPLALHLLSDWITISIVCSGLVYHYNGCVRDMGGSVPRIVASSEVGPYLGIAVFITTTYSKD